MPTKSSVDIEKRFNKSQNDLVLQASDFSLQGLKEMVDNKVIDLTPEYQRRERWGIDRQSELIESFLLNVPVPPLYLAEEDYGIYSIIDGKQRITAVTEFLKGRLQLTDLATFKELNKHRFSDLPTTLQNALRIRPYFRVITLLKQSNPKLKYEVFLRLNRGGIQLNPQEIRNVAFRGKLNDLIYETGKNVFLRSVLKISDDKSPAFQQMQDAEFVLRFLTLYKSWGEFRGGLARTMDDFMLDNQNAGPAALQRFAMDFHQAITRVSKIWGAFAFQRWDGLKWRQQALAGMWDAQMISAFSLSTKRLTLVLSQKRKLVERTKALCVEADFEKSVRLGTNIPSQLSLRVQRMSDLLADV